MRGTECPGHSHEGRGRGQDLKQGLSLETLGSKKTAPAWGLIRRLLHQPGQGTEANGSTDGEGIFGAGNAELDSHWLQGDKFRPRPLDGSQAGSERGNL